MQEELHSEPKKAEEDSEPKKAEEDSEPKQQGEASPTLKEGEGQGESGTTEPEEEVKTKTSGGAEGGIKKEVKVDYLPLDLASFQSTIECVRLFKDKNLPLHILINNAAVAWIPFGESVLLWLVSM